MEEGKKMVIFKIKIPIFIESERASQLKELGLPSEDEDETIEVCTFYQIGAICSNPDNKDQTIIFSSTGDFVSPLSVKEVEEAVDKMQEEYERTFR
jgi:hypothetical protein